MDFIAKSIIYATTDPKKFDSMINVLGYQTTSDFYTSIQTTVDTHIQDKLIPGIILESNKGFQTIHKIWIYYLDLLKFASYESLYGGAAMGLGRGLFDGLGVSFSRSIHSALDQFLRIEKWKQMSIFKVPSIVFSKRTQKNYEMSQSQPQSQSQSQSQSQYQISQLKTHSRQLDEKGLKFPTSIRHLYNNQNKPITHSSIENNTQRSFHNSNAQYSQNDLLLSPHKFKKRTLFIDIDDDNISLQSYPSSQESMQLLLNSDSLKSNEYFGWIQLIMEWKQMMSSYLKEIFSFEREIVFVQTFITGGIISLLFIALYLNAIFYFIYGIFWYGVLYLRILVSLFFIVSGFLWWHADGGKIVTSFDNLPKSVRQKHQKELQKPPTHNEINFRLLYICVILFSYSIGYLTNYVFKFPFSSTLCATFLILCIVSHMSRGVAYRVIYFLYEYYYEWKIFRTLCHFENVKQI